MFVATLAAGDIDAITPTGNRAALGFAAAVASSLCLIIGACRLGTYAMLR